MNTQRKTTNKSISRNCERFGSLPLSLSNVLDENDYANCFICRQPRPCKEHTEVIDMRRWTNAGAPDTDDYFEAYLEQEREALDYD